MVGHEDPQFDILLWKHPQAEGRAAKLLGDKVLAERLLYQKVSHPDGAAVGGYYLLRTGSDERLHDWPYNFAQWKSWLPDSHIIRAWQLLHEEDEDQRRLAKRALLDATRAGVPITVKAYAC